MGRWGFSHYNNWLKSGTDFWHRKRLGLYLFIKGRGFWVRLYPQFVP